jgi:hypothetical protein
VLVPASLDILEELLNPLPFECEQTIVITTQNRQDQSRSAVGSNFGS